MADLLPCPFCGSTNLRHEFAGSQGFIECNECGTVGPCDERAADPICDIEAAADAWNRRPTALAADGPPAELLERHAAPVPVAERLPGPKDCDAEGRCWLCGKVEGDWRLINPANAGVPRLQYYFSHWLPAHALPLPAPQGGEVEP